MNQGSSILSEGILLVDKPRGITAFTLVAILRRVLGIKTIGHAGTLDPFATGVMVMLIGKPYTKQSDSLLCQDKEYSGRLLLGKATDTYDGEGQIEFMSSYIPTIGEVEQAVAHFQGEIDQVPPMFSAKKVNGQKLCDLARKGKSVERKAVQVQVKTTLLNYEYPYVGIKVECSKGTYIRSIAHELGQMLRCGAYLSELRRTRSGTFHIDQCINGALLKAHQYDVSQIQQFLLK